MKYRKKAKKAAGRTFFSPSRNVLELFFLFLFDRDQAKKLPGQEKRPHGAAFCSQARIDNIAVNILLDLPGLYIIVQESQCLFPDQGKELLLLHHTVPQE